MDALSYIGTWMVNRKEDGQTLPLEWLRVPINPTGELHTEEEIAEALRRQKQDGIIMTNEEDVSAGPAYGGSPTSSDYDDYEFDVCLLSYGRTSLIEVVKVLRSTLNLTLEVAVNLVKNAPVTLLTRVSISDALELKAKLSKVEALVQIVNSSTKEVV